MSSKLLFAGAGSVLVAILTVPTLGAAAAASVPDPMHQKPEPTRAAAETDPGGAEQAAAVDCPPLPRGAAALVEPGGFVLVGEVHGTVEAPAFFAELVCAAAVEAGPRGLGRVSASPPAARGD